MNYHNIKYDDMLNGKGLRITLFVSGCSHHCKECQNPQTWDCNSGIPFDDDAKSELIELLSRSYIKGLTLSGGDPLYKDNIDEIYELLKYIKEVLPNKDIWIYSGYVYEEIISNENMLKVIKLCDVLVDGEFRIDLKDNNYKWAGSTNQRVIDIQKSLKENKVILLDD